MKFKNLKKNDLISVDDKVYSCLESARFNAIKCLDNFGEIFILDKNTSFIFLF